MDRSPLAALDANLLVALDALLQTRHVERAARQLSVSPSAMSHTLARLRALLDDPLLVRVGRAMAPTARARTLSGPLRDGLALLESVVAAPPRFDPARERRSLRVAAVDFAQAMLVPGLARELAAAAPGVDLVVLPFGSGSAAALAHDEIDLGLSGSRTVTGLRSRELHREPFVCLLRRGHPVLRGRLTVKRYAALEHVLISPAGSVPGTVGKALRKRGLERRIAVVVPNFNVAAEIVASSDRVLTCGERSAVAARRWLPVEVVAPPLPLEPFPLAMFWHERHEHDPFLAWARARIEAVAAAA
ncbi:MAG: LysR family transcriptional regulator [Nannocystaceae bacterium]